MLHVHVFCCDVSDCLNFNTQDFVQCQGKRCKLQLEARGSLDGIFSEISAALSKGKANPKSAAVADLVTIGDSWLNVAINKSMIEPIQALENQEWFMSLPEKWKVRTMYSLLSPLAFLNMLQLQMVHENQCKHLQAYYLI